MKEKNKLSRKEIDSTLGLNIIKLKEYIDGAFDFINKINEDFEKRITKLENGK